MRFICCQGLACQNLSSLTKLATLGMLFVWALAFDAVPRAFSLSALLSQVKAGVWSCSHFMVKLGFGIPHFTAKELGFGACDHQRCSTRGAHQQPVITGMLTCRKPNQTSATLELQGQRTPHQIKSWRFSRRNMLHGLSHEGVHGSAHEKCPIKWSGFTCPVFTCCVPRQLSEPDLREFGARHNVKGATPAEACCEIFGNV